jgi:hypothetical protein
VVERVGQTHGIVRRELPIGTAISLYGLPAIDLSFNLAVFVSRRSEAHSTENKFRVREFREGFAGRRLRYICNLYGRSGSSACPCSPRPATPDARDGSTLPGQPPWYAWRELWYCGRLAGPAAGVHLKVT